MPATPEELRLAAASVSATLSKSEQAYRLLEEQIVTMKLAPGSLISEVDLALRLGLGRTPVREALQRLAKESLVVIMPRRGIRVSDIDIKQQLRLLEVRRVLETLTSKLVAKRAGPEARQKFREIAVQMINAGKNKKYLEFVRLDRQFNALVATAADNEFTSAMLQQMHGLSRRFWHCHFQKFDDLDVASGLHASIAEAMARGDQKAAVAATDAHMDYLQSITRAAIES